MKDPTENLKMFKGLSDKQIAYVVGLPIKVMHTREIS